MLHTYLIWLGYGTEKEPDQTTESFDAAVACAHAAFQLPWAPEAVTIQDVATDEVSEQTTLRTWTIGSPTEIATADHPGWTEEA